MNKQEFLTKVYIDSHGYYRWNDSNKLIHRDVAFEHCYKPTLFGTSFGRCIVHHKNRNKLDNRPENLEVMSQRQHMKEHGIPTFFEKLINWIFGGSKK